MDEQEEFESVKLWRHVSDAIDKEDQHAATEQKSILEEAQRAGARERKEKEEAWVPRFFELVSILKLSFKLLANFNCPIRQPYYYSISI